MCKYVIFLKKNDPKGNFRNGSEKQNPRPLPSVGG